MGDYPPTDQDTVVYQQLPGRLSRLRNTFQTALGTDMKRLNDA